MTDIFSGSWVLITGASSGLGEEFARRLSARKANLILSARSKDKLDALARELAQAHGIDARVVVQDLGKPGGAQALCSQVDALKIPVDHLVSNAGYGSLSAFVESDPEWQAQMVRLNCEALVSLSRHFLPKMAARRGGGIIHLASVAGFLPLPYMTTYAATKAFVLNFSAALSAEVRGRGVRVLALCPGPVPTGFQKAAGITLQKGERLAVLSAQETVRRGLAAYEARKDVYVPGVVNRLTTLAVKFAPRGLVVSALARVMERGPARTRRSVP